MSTKLLTMHLRVTQAGQGRERGQGTLEYVGMIAVAALLIAAVVTAFSGADLGGVVGRALDKVTSII